MMRKLTQEHISLAFIAFSPIADYLLKLREVGVVLEIPLELREALIASYGVDAKTMLKLIEGTSEPVEL